MLLVKVLYVACKGVVTIFSLVAEYGLRMYGVLYVYPTYVCIYVTVDTIYNAFTFQVVQTVGCNALWHHQDVLLLLSVYWSC